MRGARRPPALDMRRRPRTVPRDRGESLRSRNYRCAMTSAYVGTQTIESASPAIGSNHPNRSTVTRYVARPSGEVHANTSRFCVAVSSSIGTASTSAASPADAGATRRNSSIATSRASLHHSSCPALTHRCKVSIFARSTRRRISTDRSPAPAIAPGAPTANTPGAMAGAGERSVDMSRRVDRAKIETLQRWVSAGHEEWCKDARLVAIDELRRVAPASAGDAADVEAVPMDEETATQNREVFAWTSPDGRATYRVTVERFGWLLPIAGEADSIVWVPTYAEVIAHR